MTLIQHLKEACARQPAASVALAAGWRDPSLAREAGTILVQEQSGVVLLDSSGAVQMRINVKRIGFRGAVISPAGDMILAEIHRHMPFYVGGHLVLFHKNTPGIRHVLDDVPLYRVDWTTTNKGASNQVREGTVRTLAAPQH